MEATSIPAHFDGERVRFDSPITLQANTRLMVVVLPEESAPRTEREEREEWYALSQQGLSRAYSDEEPEYTMDDVIEANPAYAGS